MCFMQPIKISNGDALLIESKDIDVRNNGGLDVFVVVFELEGNDYRAWYLCTVYPEKREIMVPTLSLDALSSSDILKHLHNKTGRKADPEESNFIDDAFDKYMRKKYGRCYDAIDFSGVADEID